MCIEIPCKNSDFKYILNLKYILNYYIKGINFRRYKFSRVLIFAGINSRNFVKIRENSRKLIPAKYAKMADSRKFAKINPREKFKLLVREN